MQTILGSTGQIGTELARVLRAQHTADIRLVSRRPRPIHDDDALLPADLLDPDQTRRAVAGSEVVYLTAGLPMDTAMWVDGWPRMMRHVIDACAEHGARLVFFDNTYMYPQTAVPQSEDTPFQPSGEKGRVRAAIATQLLEAVRSGKVEALIARAPEFYGPGQTQSITTTMVVDPLWNRKTAKVLLRDDTRRSLIFTPDASRALALLGNTPDAYGQTWHLPVDTTRPTYRQVVEVSADVFGVAARHRLVPRWQLALAGLFNKHARDAAELLPRYAVDNVFLDDKFRARFPDFKVTDLRTGMEQICAERRAIGA